MRIFPSGFIEKLSDTPSNDRFPGVFVYNIVIKIKPLHENHIKFQSQILGGYGVPKSGIALSLPYRNNLASVWLCFSRTITHRCRVTIPDSTHQHMQVSDFLRTAENRIESVTRNRGLRQSSQVACCYQSFIFNFQKKRNILRRAGVHRESNGEGERKREKGKGALTQSVNHSVMVCFFFFFPQQKFRLCKLEIF